MSNPRRSSNGRSPIVNPQRQITSFFTKSSSSPSPTPSPSSILPKSKSKLTPNPNSKITPKLSPAPTTTPPPSQSKGSKPVLVIGPTQSSPTTPGKSLGEDVAGRRVMVYWPLDKSWYEGCVKSFDRVSGKHLVQYDDAEEELLDLSKEKVEWIEGSVKKFRRLRKMSVVEDEEDKEGLESGGDGDDSTDEDWGKNVEKEVADDEEESMDLDEEEDDEGGSSVKKMPAKNFDFKKRKNVGEDKPSSSKKSKSGADVNGNKLIDQIDNDSE